MPYFPMFINLENKKIIVLGGGKTALRKVNSLLYFNARIAVIAPKICDEIKMLHGISVHETNLTMNVLDSADLVIAATKRQDINERIAAYCHQRKIPVNVEDNRELSSFLFPGVVVRDDLVVGITTGGSSSGIAKEIRSMIDRLIPMEYGNLTRKMAAYKQIVSVNIKDPYRREQVMDELVKTALNNRYVLDDKKANKIIEKYSRE